MNEQQQFLEVGDTVKIISKNMIGILFIIDTPYCQIKVSGHDVPILAKKDDLEWYDALQAAYEDRVLQQYEYGIVEEE